jgi:drug/metabolite transporter (DMT)-like permease
VQERLPVTAAGSHAGDFRVPDWGHLGLTVLIFGSAFMWISLGLRSLEPAVIGFGRVALGAAVLALVPAARRSIARADWGRLVTAAIAGMGAPALLFSLAQQHIDSAITGMLVGAIPIATTAAAAVMTRTMPGPRRRRGLLLGVVGIALLSIPDLTGAQAAPLGIGLVVIAVVGYSIANNLFMPLIHRYGPLPVTMWSLAVSSAALLPLGLAGLGGSTFEWLPVIAVVILGVVGTGIARALMVALIGKVGAPRGSITAYFVPVVALILGVFVLSESVEPIQLLGMTISLGGAYLVSRAD